MKKICTKCREEKPLNKFGKEPRSLKKRQDGKLTICKKCKSQKGKDWSLKTGKTKQTWADYQKAVNARYKDIMVNGKECSRCHQKKPITEFHREYNLKKSGRDGTRSICKDCHKKRSHERTPLKPIITINCEECGQEKTTKQRRTRYCSLKCNHKAFRRINPQARGRYQGYTKEAKDRENKNYKEHSKTLSNVYCRKMIVKRTGLKAADITPGMLQLKREILTIKRLKSEVKNGITRAGD